MRMTGCFGTGICDIHGHVDANSVNNIPLEKPADGTDLGMYAFIRTACTVQYLVWGD
jgi:hypothetical protein